MKSPFGSWLPVLLFSTLAGPVAAAVVSGSAARAQFEGLYGSYGGTFEDFESYRGQLLTDQLPGVEFATTLQRWPSVATVNLAVAVLPYGFLQNPGGYLAPLRNGNIPDGQSRWEIRFDSPQRWAGLVHYFNTNSLTSFYGGANLLGTHQNATNAEFVGYIADSDDPASWVTRIVMDGNAVGSPASYQVGYGDDLFFGVEVPEPSIALMFVAGLAGLLRRTPRRHPAR